VTGTVDRVSYTQMKHGTKEDYELLMGGWANDDNTDAVVSTLLDLVERQDGDNGAHPISRREHSLQSGTRAVRDGADDETIFIALLHDIGDVLALHNHSEVSAAILRPYLSDEAWWVVRHHGIFQTYYYAHHLGGDRHERDQHRDHPHFAACVRFCERYDQCSFDPAYVSLTPEDFAPIVRRVVAARKHQWV
jgi:predicted HD phosphohydrolase